MKFFIYFLLFFICSIVGWIYELIYGLIQDRKFVNRGFLIGPYLPIYGTGSIIMILYLNQYKENPLTVFVLAMVICTFIEYITSYLMEKLFNARWWDYSNQKFNINGRVALFNSLLFGILSLLLIYVVNPLYLNLIDNMNNTWLFVISITCFIIFIIDFIISFNIVRKIKDNLNNSKLDSTIEIRKLINSKIKRNHLHNRIFNAFPKIKFFSKK